MNSCLPIGSRQLWPSVSTSATNFPWDLFISFSEIWYSNRKLKTKVTDADFPEKFLLPFNWQKGSNMGLKEIFTFYKNYIFTLCWK